MSIIQAIVLGIIQGITEFVPISSDGHLILIREVFGWQDPGLVFDIFLHSGTLLAVLIYFRQDWLKIWQSLWGKTGERELIVNFIIATIPAIIIGLVFNNYISTIFRHTLWIAAFFIIEGLFYLSAEKYADHKIVKKDAEQIKWLDALIIGFSQALALLPGVSRSGMTIASGMFRSVKRTEATRFSFLLGTIAIIGASLFGLIEAASDSNYLVSFWPEIIIGSVVAAVAGYFSIKYLLKFLAHHKLNIFAGYLIVLGIILFVIEWFN